MSAPRMPVAAALPLLLASGCVDVAVKETADPKLIERHKVRLMRHFDQPYTVHCRTLTVEVNPIYLRQCTMPAGKPNRRRGQGFEDRSWSIADRVDSQLRRHRRVVERPVGTKLQFFIGKTRFVVDTSVRVRSLFKAPPTLTAHATGRVILVVDGKNAKQFEEVRFAEGDVHSR